MFSRGGLSTESLKWLQINRVTKPLVCPSKPIIQKCDMFHPHNALPPSLFSHEHIATRPWHRVNGLVNGQYIASHYVGALSLAMSIGLCISNDDNRVMGRIKNSSEDTNLYRFRPSLWGNTLIKCWWMYSVSVGCPCIHGYIDRWGVSRDIKGMLHDEALGCLLFVGMRCLLDILV
jgi:hypothetical protein